MLKIKVPELHMSAICKPPKYRRFVILLVAMPLESHRATLREWKLQYFTGDISWEGNDTLLKNTLLGPIRSFTIKAALYQSSIQQDLIQQSYKHPVTYLKR